MAKITALIVDDEMPARCELHYILDNIPTVQVIGECTNGQEVLDFLQDNKIDIIFLDIEMPIMDGIETAKRIHALSLDSKIVFSTGFDQFAIQAFELEVFDYVLKPYNEDRIAATISRLQSNIEQSKKIDGEIVCPHNKFAVYSKEKFVVLNPKKDIIMIKSDKSNYTLFYTTKGILTSKILLKDAEEKLFNMGFCRTHKCFIVNLNMIEEIIPWFNETFLLILQNFNKEEVPVSRHYIKAFKEFMKIT
mgnify:CR=1 FL=1